MRFSTQQTAGGDYYLMVIDLSNGDSYDFGGAAWAAYGTGTTPRVDLTEVACGEKSIYYGDVDLTALFPASMAPKDLVVKILTRAGGSPNYATDVAIASPTKLRLVGGHVDADNAVDSKFRVAVTSVLTSNAGTSAHVTAELTYEGRTVDLNTLDSGATCDFEVTLDASTTGGNRSSQFTVSAVTLNTSNRFEAEQSSPAYTSNKGYTVVASITAGGVTYTGSCYFQVL
jgi:hypothetical protein